MKKKIPLICMVAVVIVLAGSGAWAYTYSFTPYTPVEEYNAAKGTGTGGPTGNWTSTPIAGSGDTSFNIQAAYLVTYNGQTYLTIYTGWAGPSYTEYGAVAADLTITNPVNGYTYMVGLSSASNVKSSYGGSVEGNLYTNPGTIYHSVDFFGPSTNPMTGYDNTKLSIYGGAYGSHSSPSYIPVWCTGSPTQPSGLVTWVAPGYNGIQPGSSGGNGIWGANGSSGSGIWEVEVDLSIINSSVGFPAGFSFIYATATCANSLLTGCYTGSVKGVPLPPSALLLGTGLLGLVGLGWRRKKER